MNIIIDSFTVINRPITVNQMPEYEEIRWKGRYIGNSTSTFYKEWPNPFNIPFGDDAILIDCMITSYDFTIGDGDEILDTSVEGIAQYIDKPMNLKLLDREIMTRTYTYKTIRDNYGLPEEMTYKEFRDYVIMENL